MSRRSVAIVCLLQFAALVVVCLLIGDNGWDDGAITLAFARTFARHGRIALTPRSEVVEGFSSVSWFLLNALAALARPSYRAAIFVSQVLSALSICATTVLLARTCALLQLDRLFTTLTVVAFAAWGCSFAEASNGMEMGLLAAAFLVMVNELLSPQPRMLWLGAGVVLAVTTRFEALFYVALLALTVVSVPGRRAFWGIVLPCLGTVLLLSCWRLAVFSDVLPNTFWAKRWPPYAASGVVARVAGAWELPRFFLLPLIALPLIELARRLRFLSRRGAAAPPQLCDPRCSDPGSCPGGRSGRTVLGLSRTDAVLRVSAGVVALLARVLVMGERQANQVPGGARGRPVPVFGQQVEDGVSLGHAARRIRRRCFRDASCVRGIRSAFSAFHLRRRPATGHHPHAGRWRSRPLL